MRPATNFPVWHIAVLMTLAVLPPMARAATPSFLCTKATGWVEKTICADQALADLDLELAAVYARTLSTPDNARRQVQESSQRRWWASRGTCQRDPAPLECLSRSYRARITQLRDSPDYPGDTPGKAKVIIQDASITQGGKGWTRDLSVFARAITRCRVAARVHVARVDHAQLAERGEAVRLWLRTADSRRLVCQADKRGEAVSMLREAVDEEDPPAGESALDLNASTPPPACAPVPVLDSQGKDFGWLVKAGC